MVSCGEHYSNMFTCLHLKTKTHAKAKVGYIFVNFLLNFSFFFSLPIFTGDFGRDQGGETESSTPGGVGTTHLFATVLGKVSGR